MSKQQAALLQRYRGALLGLAVGDAVGTTLEFKPPGTFTPIDDIVGGGPFNLQAGQWTDDTAPMNGAVLFWAVTNERQFCSWSAIKRIRVF